MDQNTLAILTLIVVFVTALGTTYYAWQSRRSVIEMRLSRHQSADPILSCEIIWEKDESFIRGAWHVGKINSIKIRNVGNGPAFNIELHCEPTDCWEFRTPNGTIGTLAVGETCTRSVYQGNSFKASGQVELTTRLRYQDLYDSRFATVAQFRLEIMKPGATENAPTGNWLKLRENRNVEVQKNWFVRLLNRKRNDP